ncbi:MAG: hypothetical protein ABI721_01500 [Candidatus Dojkabacteria bacterium]
MADIIVEDGIVKFGESQLLVDYNSFLESYFGISLLTLVSTPISEDEKQYQAEDVIALFNFAAKNFLEDPENVDYQDELLRCIAIIYNSFKSNKKLNIDEVFEVIVSPFIEKINRIFTELSVKIRYELLIEGDFASEDEIDSYRFYRRILSYLNRDLDGNFTPVRDDLYTHYELIQYEPDSSLSPDEQKPKYMPFYIEEKEYLDYIFRP